jgi:hypothetical protein
MELENMSLNEIACLKWVKTRFGTEIRLFKDTLGWNIQERKKGYLSHVLCRYAVRVGVGHDIKTDFKKWL